jgi:hypothetical protein
MRYKQHHVVYKYILKRGAKMLLRSKENSKMVAGCGGCGGSHDSNK